MFPFKLSTLHLQGIRWISEKINWNFIAISKSCSLVELNLENMKSSSDDTIIANLSFFKQLKTLSLTGIKFENEFLLEVTDITPLETLHLPYSLFHTYFFPKEDVPIFPASLRLIYFHECQPTRFGIF